MAKNDFDIDFDFEKEYGFDPKAILDSEDTDEDLDLSQFDDDALLFGEGWNKLAEVPWNRLRSKDTCCRGCKVCHIRLQFPFLSIDFENRISIG